MTAWLTAGIRWLGVKGLAILLSIAAALSWLAWQRRMWKREGRNEAVTEMIHAKEEAADEARAIEREARHDGAGAARDFLRRRKTTDRRR